MANKIIDESYWDVIIKPKASLLSIDFNEIWNYRDLLVLFVKREIVQFYKQTILGPVWFFIQPLLTTLVYTIVFGNIAHIPTDGKPAILFYLAGIILWNYFSDVLNNTAATFRENAQLFGKVYFPRIIAPASKAISNILKLAIQLLLFLSIYFYLFFTQHLPFNIHWSFLLIPIYIIILFNLGLGFGMIITSLTAKYKDLIFLISFGVQLLMYASPVIYSLDSLKNSKYYYIVLSNPISPVIELFRNSILGGRLDFNLLLYSFVVSIFVFGVGLIVFNKTEKTFIDTI